MIISSEITRYTGLSRIRAKKEKTRSNVLFRILSAIEIFDWENARNGIPTCG
jgi:hypothetical protein